MDKPIAKDISETTCKRCGEDYSLDYGCDPTPYCHQCAHELVEELEAEREELIERTSAAEARVKELEAQVERLSAPVSDEEKYQASRALRWLEGSTSTESIPSDIRSYMTELFESIIAFRAAKEKPCTDKS